MYKIFKGHFPNCTRSIRIIRRIFARTEKIRHSQLRIAGLLEGDKPRGTIVQQRIVKLIIIELFRLRVFIRVVQPRRSSCLGEHLRYHWSTPNDVYFVFIMHSNVRVDPSVHQHGHFCDTNCTSCGIHWYVLKSMPCCVLSQLAKVGM